MELSYWKSRWNKGKIGFHMPDGYPGLSTHWPALNLPGRPSVLVPLCGKSVDLLILEQLGADVTGVETSQVAVENFFSENNREFTVEQFAGFEIYRSGKISIWEGDFFKLPQKLDNIFDLIYDKAALVALPKPMRVKYSEKLLSISGDKTTILLHHFIYPQAEMPGPPFSVSMDEIRTHFAARYSINKLEEKSIPANNYPPFERRGLQSNLKEQLLLLNPTQKR